MLHLIFNARTSDLQACMLQRMRPGDDGFCLHCKYKGNKPLFWAYVCVYLKMKTELHNYDPVYLICMDFNHNLEERRERHAERSMINLASFKPKILCTEG